MPTARVTTIAARLVTGFGLVESCLDECSERLDRWQLASRSSFHVIGSTNDNAEAIEFLSRLTFPATRHILVSLQGWTAFVNNTKNGSDFADDVRLLARRLDARAARVVDRPSRFWTDGVQHEIMAYEARIFELYGKTGDLLRSVTCMNDGGRWFFGTQGVPHPIEAFFDYGAKRKKDRLTPDALRRLLEAFGLPWLDTTRFLEAGRYVLVREDYASQEWSRQIEERACTFEEGDDPARGYYERGLGWVKHMQTHAESVVADFERAVRLNGDYEPLVREYLAAARREISRRRE